MVISVLEDRVLLRPRAKEEVTSGGIILHTNSVLEKTVTATVVVAGPGKSNKDGVARGSDLTPGDTVVLEKLHTKEVTINNEKLLIAHESDILYKVE